MNNTSSTIDDEIFDALADVRRRQLLLGLLYQDTQHIFQLTGISRELVDANDGLLRKHLSGSRHVPGADKNLVRTYHVHLPKLVEYGLIEWDRDAHVVTKGPRFEDVRPLLELLDRQRDDHPPSVLERSVRRTR